MEAKSDDGWRSLRLLGCGMVSNSMVYWMANSRILRGFLHPIITINSMHWRIKGIFYYISSNFCHESLNILTYLQSKIITYNIILISGINGFSVKRITTSIFLCWSHDERNTRRRCNEVKKNNKRKSYLLFTIILT